MFEIVTAWAIGSALNSARKSMPSPAELELAEIDGKLKRLQSELAQYDGSHVFVDSWMQGHIKGQIEGLERRRKAIQSRISDHQRVFGRD